MIRTIWLRRLRRWMFSHPASTIDTLPQRARVRPRLEVLEDRTLLSGLYLVNLTTDNVPNTGQSTPTPVGYTGSGDLRYCIEQADLNPGSTIVFDPSVFPTSGSTTIALSQGELYISASMTITDTANADPNGPIRDPNTIIVSGTDGKGGASRVFDIGNQLAVVAINGLTITNGNASVYYSSVPGKPGRSFFKCGQSASQHRGCQNGLGGGGPGGPAGPRGRLLHR